MSKKALKSSKPLYVPHAKGKDPDCPICEHPQRQLIEEAFVNLEKSEDVAAIAGVDIPQLLAHARQGLLAARVDNTAAFYGKIITSWADNFDPEDVGTQDALQAARQLDLMAGRMQPEFGGGRTTVQFVVGPPAAAGAFVRAEGQKVLEGDEDEALTLPAVGSAKVEAEDG